MSHITYNEFKNRFGDLGITKYTKAMWLEEGCEEIGKLTVIATGLGSVQRNGDAATISWSLLSPGDEDYATIYGDYKFYTQGFAIATVPNTPNTIYWYQASGRLYFYFVYSSSLTDDEIRNSVLGNVILYKKKIIPFSIFRVYGTGNVNVTDKMVTIERTDATSQVGIIKNPIGDDASYNKITVTARSGNDKVTYLTVYAYYTDGTNGWTQTYKLTDDWKTYEFTPLGSRTIKGIELQSYSNASTNYSGSIAYVKAMIGS